MPAEGAEITEGTATTEEGKDKTAKPSDDKGKAATGDKGKSAKPSDDKIKSASGDKGKPQSKEKETKKK